MFEPYPQEVLNQEWEEDNGTMPDNVATLADAVVGHKIVSVEKNVEIPAGADLPRYFGSSFGTQITLDNGKQVYLIDGGDCCAFTELNNFLLHPDKVDHVITGVGTTEGYTKWHIYADFGDVVELDVAWSCGNPFYYAYGFEIVVVDAE
jgi:hypothetical protein